MIKICDESKIDYLNKMLNGCYKLTNDPFSKRIVFELENKIIGFADYSIIYDRCELNYIYVANNYRGKNIATQLLNYIIEDIKGFCNNITLEVSTINIPAINLYKKFKFEIVSTRRNYYGDTSAYLMIRKFDNNE